MQNLRYDDHMLKLAAIIYRSGVDDIDAMLATFAADLIREGHRIGGIVQRNSKGECGPRDLMHMIDLMTVRFRFARTWAVGPNPASSIRVGSPKRRCR